MAKIVAFSVPSEADGRKALEELEDIDGVKDVAMVFKNDKGKVKIRQTSDATVGKSAVGGGLLGAVVSIFAGPLVGVAAAGAAAGGVYGALRDKGVNDKLMKLAGAQLEDGTSSSTKARSRSGPSTPTRRRSCASTSLPRADRRRCLATERSVARHHPAAIEATLG